ncbi:MAG: 2-oxo acid dehydrogenase subunit E2 [Planctomycetes bacterium]|nr:2-oxo acid dehydrogenase subunit E2 [Planctomycetota bacterium]
MPIEITMPRLSDTMEEGTLVKWKVKVGDKVKAGDVVADVETDKATMELPVYDDGTIALLAAGEGQTLAVGALILVLAQKGESVEDAAKSVQGRPAAAPAAKAAPSASPKAAPATTAAATAVSEDDGEEAAVATSGARVRVSPLAKRIADDKGIDLARVKGTGPDGRIIKRDVLSAPAAPAGGAKPAASAKPAPPAISTAALSSLLVPVTNMRKTIARRLLESKTTIPHFTVTVAVNMDLLLGERGAKKQLESQGIKLSVNDFVVRAAALALLNHPGCNASWTDAGIQMHGAVNIGVAVALPAEKGGGLVVPVVRDVNNKSLRTINAEVKHLAEKARTQGLTVEEMSDGTFTISNLGMLGVDHFEAIINPPQAAILAVGASITKPIVRDGQIVVGQEMTCTLSADHRVIDGAMAAEYLKTLKSLLENPAVLMV